MIMNSNSDKKGVVEKIINISRESFISRTPLIAIDTYEIELVEKVVRSFDMVDFKVIDKDVLTNDKVTKYLCATYEEMPLNFPKNIEEINNYIKSGNDMPFKGMVQITDYENKDKNEKNFARALRKYVHMYVNCHDESDYIRNSVIFLYGDVQAIPDDLREKYTTIIDVDYPETWERIQVVRDAIEKHDLIRTMELTDPTYIRDDALIEEAITSIAVELAGFSLTECEKIVRYLVQKGKAEGKDSYFIFDSVSRQEFIFEKKEQTLKALGGIMELIKPPKTKKGDHEPTVKGFENYDKWINKISKQMVGSKNSQSDFTLKRGVGNLKGVLVCGIPGCGKSEAAGILGIKWKMNILRLDIGSLMDRLVGSSEKNLRKALRCAEIMSPVILFIDEIDKGFSGANSSGNSEGSPVFKRMFGYLLNWMQTNTKEVFIFATANDMSNLPPEFFRSGRYDSLFAAYMPTAAECVEVFREQMKRSEQQKVNKAREYNNDSKPKNNFDFSLEKPTNEEEKDYLGEALAEVIKTAGDYEKFLTGADIKKIVEHTLRVANEEQIDKQFTIGEWKTALIETVKDRNMITYGYSTSNQDKIATTYVRLMRQKLIPVSGESIFDYNDYKVDYSPPESSTKSVKARYYGEYKSKNIFSENNITKMLENYDKAFFEIIKEKINFFADMVEESEAKKSTS